MRALLVFLIFLASARAIHVYYGPPKEATVRERPFHAALYKNNAYHCSAAAISKQCAVTACSCVVDLAMQLNETKTLGDSYTLLTYSRHLRFQEAKRQPVSQVFIAGGCDVQTQQNDAAVVCSTTQVNGDPVVVVKERTNENVRGIVSGWGLSVRGEKLVHKDLRRAYMRIIGLEECRRRYAGVREVPESALCAVATDDVRAFCSGDVGGPLTHGEGLVGIAAASFGCEDKKYPGIFTDTAKLSDFFENVIAEFEKRKPEIK